MLAAEHELAAEQLDRAHRGGDHRLRAEALEQAGRLAAVGQAASSTARSRWPTGWPACGAAPSPSPSNRRGRAGRRSARSRFRRRARAAAPRPAASAPALRRCEIGYSRSSDSIAQNGAGLSRTACTHGGGLHRGAGQSSRPDSDRNSSPTIGASSRYGDGNRAFIGWSGCGEPSIVPPRADQPRRCCGTNEWGAVRRRGRQRARAGGAAATRRSTLRRRRPAPAARRRPARARSIAGRRAGGHWRRSRPAR